MLSYLSQTLHKEEVQATEGAPWGGVEWSIGREGRLTGGEVRLAQSPGRRHQPRASVSYAHREWVLEGGLAERGVPRGRGFKAAREGQCLHQPVDEQRAQEPMPPIH